MTVYLDVKDGVVRDISFQGEGCAIARASASMMTSVVKGKSLADASETFKRFRQMITGGQDPCFDLEDLGKLAAFSDVCAFPVRSSAQASPGTPWRGRRLAELTARRPGRVGVDCPACSRKTPPGPRNPVTCAAQT